MTLAALIFDVDGTLAETEEAHRHAFNLSFAEAGLGWHWDRDTYRRLLRTTGGKERMRRYAQETGQPAPDVTALHARKTETYARQLAQGLALRPGVADLVTAARAAGLRLAVATTTSAPNVQALARACWDRDADQVFDVIAAGDEVPRKKPAADIYTLALARLGLPAGAALAFEDSRNGVLAARGAGLRVVVTPALYTEAEDFTGALAVIPSLESAHWPEPLATALAGVRA
ncbi:HAD-IA family hydrolase [Salipiger marinus]|uniref:Haloacid dehalogenase superfamily, subfamily IA, variant 3 with third motif having DD or ED n=2 Tax=Salipiger marinus TaxID=555512 RepID=A0A1G8IPU4_9RHOB|nr:HAD-IA family hydrolase [Salipiger marinus]SDI20530.1 haloacid dehalogenase superfamily, subfamily IA, variant 3 with third motif having DD or ED [Salipiger marinus]